MLHLSSPLLIRGSQTAYLRLCTVADGDRVRAASTAPCLPPKSRPRRHRSLRSGGRNCSTHALQYVGRFDLLFKRRAFASGCTTTFPSCSVTNTFQPVQCTRVILLPRFLPFRVEALRSPSSRVCARFLPPVVRVEASVANTLPSHCPQAKPSGSRKQHSPSR